MEDCKSGLGYSQGACDSKGNAIIPLLDSSFYSAESSASPMGALIESLEKLDVQTFDTAERRQIKARETEDFSFDLSRIFD